MSHIDPELFVVGGFDEYTGSARNVTVVIDRGAFIKVKCDGSDGDGVSLITPDQARYLAQALLRLSSSISEFYSQQFKEATQ